MTPAHDTRDDDAGPTGAARGTARPHEKASPDVGIAGAHAALWRRCTVKGPAMQDGLTSSDNRRPVANPGGTRADGACALDANGDVKTPPALRRFTKDGPETVQIQRATDIPSGGSWHPLRGGAQSTGVRLKPADPAPRVVGRP